MVNASSALHQLFLRDGVDGGGGSTGSKGGGDGSGDISGGGGGSGGSGGGLGHGPGTRGSFGAFLEPIGAKVKGVPSAELCVAHTHTATPCEKHRDPLCACILPLILKRPR